MKKAKKVVIVAGGTLQKHFISQIKRGDTIIGVDRGALWLLRQGVTLQLAIGDFDSVTTRELATIKRQVAKTKVHPKEKDATDLELAIDEAIRLKPNEVIIFGALGTRFDHTLGAIHALTKLVSYNIYGEIVDNFNKIYIVRHQRVLTKSQKYRYVSLFPLKSDAVITLTGFRYNLRRFRLQTGSTLGISNEFQKKNAVINVHAGAVLVVESRDRTVR